MKKITFGLLIISIMAVLAACSTTSKKEDVKCDNVVYCSDVQPTFQNADMVLCQATVPDENPLGKFDVKSVLNICLSVISVLFAGFLAKAKSKIGQIVNLGREVIEAAEDVEKALSDDKLTEDEINNCKADFNDVKEAFKALISKDKK